ncbi:hypothetical protein [Laceyella putida]|uniref:Uncharacterized protein n=1 Tax=Laceyella putida TaxID=110101 RepID=A0ABW2RFH4_9BACL
MKNHLPGLTQLHDQYECPRCRSGFGLLQGSPLETIQCPECGEMGSKQYFLTSDSLLFELALSRQKMEKAVLKAKLSQNGEEKN